MRQSPLGSARLLNKLKACFVNLIRTIVCIQEIQRLKGNLRKPPNFIAKGVGKKEKITYLA